MSSLINYPYGAQCAAGWKEAAERGLNGALESGMLNYTLSQNCHLSKIERLQALKLSLDCFESLSETESDNLHLASYARAAQDYGFRSLAVAALARLHTTITEGKRVTLNEPFLSPMRRFESVVPSGPLRNWVLAATLEGLEQLLAYSSYYTGEGSRPRLLALRDLGYSSEEMQRRLKLVERRFGKPAS